MHGLVHHTSNNNSNSQQRREKSPGLDHKRSVSDEGPVSASKAGRSGLSRTLNAARYHRRGASSVAEGRTAVSMDLPRPKAGGMYQTQAAAEEEERTTTTPSGKRAGGFWGGLLRRKG